jgi:hypothetical protein
VSAPSSSPLRAKRRNISSSTPTEDSGFMIFAIHMPPGWVRSRHGSRSGEWHISTPQPLLRDARTGYAHPGCYARATCDCSSKLRKSGALDISRLAPQYLCRRMPTCQRTPGFEERRSGCRRRL